MYVNNSRKVVEQIEHYQKAHFGIYFCNYTLTYGGNDPYNESQRGTEHSAHTGSAGGTG